MNGKPEILLCRWRHGGRKDILTLMLFQTLPLRLSPNHGLLQITGHKVKLLLKDTFKGRSMHVHKQEDVHNGLISNDKFCLTRRQRLELSFWIGKSKGEK